MQRGRSVGLVVRRAAGVLLAAALATTAPGAQAQDAAVTARQALSALAADESARPAGRLTISITERRGRYVAGEKPEAMRERIGKEEAASTEGTMLYGPSGWRSDLTGGASGKRPPLHKVTAQTAGLLRILVEAKVEGEEQRRGWVIPTMTATPSDAVLSRRVASALAGVGWTSARPEGDRLTLEGTRGDERDVVVLRSGAVPQVLSWSLTRRLEGPSGEKIEQTYTCAVTPGESPAAPSRVEEWVLNPPPAANVGYRATDVRKREDLPGVKPVDLSVTFPRGTLVTDTRSGAPVEYEVAAEGLNEESVAAAVKTLASGRAKVGDPAPDFSLTDVRGKAVRLQDYRGSTLVLFWFSTRSDPAAAAAETVRALAAHYRGAGVQVVGISVAEAEDAARQAEAFGKRYKWQFPVAVDTDNETIRRYGTETAVPKVAIVNAAGTIAYVQAGFDPEGIATVLDQLTQRKP